MSWTDERVEQLRQLWLDGKSASQIATVLASGITRNAVIGKVHRLGLSGRVKAPSQSIPRQRAPKPLQQQQQHSSHRTQHTMRTSQGPRTQGATALAYSPRVEMRPMVRPMEEVVVPICDPVTIMDLKESMCRWPMGDPATPEFRYCGGPSPMGVPYCSFHSRVAYQPVQDRRNRRPMGPKPFGS